MLKYMACLDEDAGYEDAFVVGWTDDRRWMFWEMRTAPSEYAQAQFHLPMEEALANGATRLKYVAGYWTGTNMGSRPSSQINCRDSEEWLEAWRVEMDQIVAEWLPTRSQAMQDCIADRRRLLGEVHARPYYANVFTDDYLVLLASPSLAAGAAAWQRRNKQTTAFWYMATTSWTSMLLFVC